MSKLFWIGALLAAAASPASAQSANTVDFGDGVPGVTELVEALEPPPVSFRGDKAPPSSASLRIRFDVGSARVAAADEPKLKNLALALKNERLQPHQFQIIGHTDATGPLPLNMRLSQQRARSVMSYLIAQGIEPQRLKPEGRGPNELAKPEDPRASANRRVELRLAK